MYVFGVSWDDSKKPRAVAILLACALLLAVAVSPGARAATASSKSDLVSVIVRETPGATSAARNAVGRLGGRLGARLAVINGFAARVPRSALDDLRAANGVLSVTSDARVKLHAVNSFDPKSHPGSMYSVANVVDADSMWYRGYAGQGVDVALIDSGVVPVDGLTRPGKVINGPDLSFESQDENLRYLDTFGHGTHMAGIIAGLDTKLPRKWSERSEVFAGIAPGARIVNIKVADALGNTDVSQVIAAIDWVVQHRHDNGMNIRVLNLSFGTDSVQPAALDPLSYAAEVAWRKGIVVVVAAGNRGFGSKRLNNPAFNPFVIAVGSADTHGTEGTSDDEVSSFSSVGTSGRTVDILAPGRSVVSLRDPGSFVDVNFPSARTSSRFFKGSGTSQAAAVVSGAAALLLDQRPSMTPDQVKRMLMSTADSLPNEDFLGQGEGLINLDRARLASTPSTGQTHTPATGLGRLEGARGSIHLYADGKRLDGERDIFGTPWNATTWVSDALNESSWDGGRWNGVPWTDGAWDGTSWAGPSWGSVVWTKNSWSGDNWNRNSWSKNSWSGNGWTGGAWARNSWSGDDWSKNSWSHGGWLGDYWVEDRSASESGLKNSWSGVDWSILDCFGVQALKNSWSAADWAELESFGTQMFKNSWSGVDWAEFELGTGQMFKNSWSGVDWAEFELGTGQVFKNSWSSEEWSESGCRGEVLKNSWSGADWAELESFGTQMFKNSWSGADWSEAESFGTQMFKNSWSSSAWK